LRVAGGVLAALVILVAAVFVLLPGGERQFAERSAMDKPSFAGAVAALAAAPEVRYLTDTAGLGMFDVRATATGEFIGKAESVQLLRMDGRVYVKLPESALPRSADPTEAAAMRDRWLTGGAVSEVLGKLPDRFVPPQRLASVLASALRTARPFGSTVVDNERVHVAKTRLGTVYVARDEPYRLVRLEPVTADGLRMQASSEATDFPATQPEKVGETYDALEAAAPQLAEAMDTDIQFHMQGNGQIGCSAAGCQVTVTVSSSVTAEPGTTVRDGNVNAVLNATVAIEGQPAGGCSSAGPLPLNGSGSLTCMAAGAGSVFASTEARKKAAAEAQSRSQGGRPVQYQVAYTGQYHVHATAQVNATELAQKVAKNGDDTVNIYKAPSTGATDKLMNEGFRKEDFPGDPKQWGYPDGRAYFGMQDRGRQIALDYATRGGYDRSVVQICIPKADFERHFRAHVLDYDGVPDAQIAIPNTMFDILNRYPRSVERC
jgi:hypothetical protein